MTYRQRRPEPDAFRWARELDRQPRTRRDSENERLMIDVATQMENLWEKDTEATDTIIRGNPMLRIFLHRCHKAGLEGMTRAFALSVSRFLDRPAVAVMYAAYVAYLADCDGVKEPGMADHARWFGNRSFDTETLRDAWLRQKLGNFDKGTDNMLDLHESYNSEN